MKRALTIVGTLLAGTVMGAAGVTVMQTVTCTTSSATPCVGINGRLSGQAVLVAHDNAGNPVLVLPTISGDLVTADQVKAMMAAGNPSPTPTPTPIPTPTPPTLYTINGVVMLYTNNPFSSATVELDDANGVFIAKTNTTSTGAFSFSATSGKTYNVKLATQGWAGAPQQFAIINANAQPVNIKFTAYNPNHCPGTACTDSVTIP